MANEAIKFSKYYPSCTVKFLCGITVTVVFVWGYFVVLIVVLLFVYDFIIYTTIFLQTCANYTLKQSNDLL